MEQLKRMGARHLKVVFQSGRVVIFPLTSTESFLTSNGGNTYTDRQDFTTALPTDPKVLNTTPSIDDTKKTLTSCFFITIPMAVGFVLIVMILAANVIKRRWIL